MKLKIASEIIFSRAVFDNRVKHSFRQRLENLSVELNLTPEAVLVDTDPCPLKNLFKDQWALTCNAEQVRKRLCERVFRLQKGRVRLTNFGKPGLGLNDVLEVAVGHFGIDQSLNRKMRLLRRQAAHHANHQVRKVDIADILRQ